jgi:hypothetical protein
MLKFAVQASDTLAHRTLYDPISKLNAVIARPSPMAVSLMLSKWLGSG